MKFQKTSVVDARRWDGAGDWTAMAEWFAAVRDGQRGVPILRNNAHLIIPTPTGLQIVIPGAYVISLGQGLFDVCDGQKFADTHCPLSSNTHGNGGRDE